jgi:lysyl-tRNA synthetase class 2
MSMDINNTELLDNVSQSDNTGISDKRIFDNSKIAKLNSIRTKGLNPYPYKFEKSEDICDILKKFEDYEKNEGLTVRTAGKLYNIRKHWKMIFADLGDQAGRIQILFRKGDLLDEDFEIFKNLVDSGDIIGIQGNLFRMKRGENSINVSKFSYFQNLFAQFLKNFMA